MTEPTQLQMEILAIRQALTATAGVDCGCGYDKPDDVCMVHEPIVKAHVAEMKERCAQVVESFGERWASYDYEAKEIAAAIRAQPLDIKWLCVQRHTDHHRALKDKP